MSSLGSFAPQGIGKRILILTGSTSNSNNDNAFVPIGGLSSNPVESRSQSTLDYDIILKSLKTNQIVNTKNVDITVTFRDDGVDVSGSSITVTAASVAEFSVTNINQLIAAGSKINFRRDTSGSSSGSLDMSFKAYCEVV